MKTTFVYGQQKVTPDLPTKEELEEEVVIKFVQEQ